MESPATHDSNAFEPVGLPVTKFDRGEVWQAKLLPKDPILNHCKLCIPTTFMDYKIAAITLNLHMDAVIRTK
jgi:hypothetical protein